MSDETTAKLEARKEEIVKEFEALDGKGKALLEQNKNTQRSLNEIQARQIELRGGLQEVRTLLGEDLTQPLGVAPKKEKKKK